MVDLIISVPHFPVENEETVQSDGMQRQLGGSSNFLIMSSRLGLKAGVIDHLGDDEYGNFYRENLSREGVDVSGLSPIIGAQTAHCICMVDQRGNHSYISFPGATYSLSSEYIDHDYIKDSKALYLSGYSLTKEPIREATLTALSIAVENQLRVYFDPSPQIAHIPSETLQHVIDHSEGVFINERELSILASKLPQLDLQDQRGFTALKQGEKGCTIISEGNHHLYQAQKVEIVDTTGAGDVFNAAFIYGRINDWSHTRCASFANKLAALKVQRLGAGLNVPTRDQAQRLLDEVLPV